MNSRLTTLVVLFLGLAPRHCFAQEDTKPWPADRWAPISGDWRAEGGEYVQMAERAYGVCSLCKSGKYLDVDVQVRFRIEPVGRGVRAAGVVFKAVDPQHLFFAHFDSKNNQVLVSRWSQESGWKHLARLRRVGLKQGEWQTGRVQLVGTKVTIYLDGRRLGTAKDVPRLPGRVGLRSGQGRVRYRDWRVSGESVRQAQTGAHGPLPWWNPAWQRRIPLTLSEPGIADRDAALTKVRLDFAGHARVLGATTDVVVVAADGRIVPSSVAPLTRDGERIRKAEVAFPARVDWMMAARYDVYFNNPKAAATKEKDLTMSTLSLTQLPSDWKFADGDWRQKALTRLEPNPNRSPAVKSEHHVAFPGICKTKSGALVVVYREGYSHASGKPDDGRVMLVRSADKGQTWSEPAVIQDDPGADDRNAAIECMGDGTLCVIWDKYGKGRYPTYGHHWAWMRTSPDEARTWSEPMKISKDEDVHTRSRPLDLDNGKWLIPYSESTGRKTASSYFAMYDPKTKTFDEIAATPFGQRNIADETAVTRAPNGDLVALIRSNVDPALWKIVSKDDGRTWSDAKLTDIPSQFTPCDLITLSNGWLMCSFSFRERRNERMCVSRDNGETWDVENSVDVFDGTPNIGGDRSYHASVQIDDSTIGSVLYETQTPPTGGHIWFVTTPLAALSAPKENVLYQGDRQTDAAFALWPESVAGETVELSYRFTGLFGPVPNVVGLLMDYDDPQNYTAFEYQMGAARDRKGSPYNACHLAQCVAGEAKRSHTMTAQGDWYDDGNIHRLGARRSNGQWTFTIDGVDQFAVPESVGKPCGIIVRRATVAVYEIDFCDQAVQRDGASLNVQAGQIEERKPE